MRLLFCASCLLAAHVACAQMRVQTSDYLSVHQNLFPLSFFPTPAVAGNSASSDVLVEKKKVGLAVIYSLLLPGMGELYVGEYEVGKYFTIGEALLWLTYTSFEFYGNWLRDDARKFAAFHAGVNPSGKNDRYFVDIGNFLNTDEYNAHKLRAREFEQLYDVNSSYFWQWDSDANRAAYRELRISHDRAFNDARFVVAAIIVNHIVSAVNAARLAVSHNKRLDESFRIDVRARPLGGFTHTHGIMISVVKNF